MYCIHVRCSEKVSNSFDDYIMLPEVKQSHSGVQSYSTAPTNLMKKLIIMSFYEMFLYTNDKDLWERRVQRGSWIKRLSKTKRKVKAFVFYKNRKNTPVSSKIQRYVKFKSKRHQRRFKEMQKVKKYYSLFICVCLRHFSGVITIELIIVSLN